MPTAEPDAEGGPRPSTFARAVAMISGVALIVGVVSGLIWAPTHWRDYCQQHLWCHKHYAVEAYMTNNPSKQPPKRSSVGELMGVAAGTSRSTIAAMFPPEPETSYSISDAYDSDKSAGWRIETWTWRGISLSVEADKAGATRDVEVGVDPENRWLVSGPYGTLIGYSTIQQVVDAYAEHGENPVLSMSYDEDVDGGYGTFDLVYAWGAEGGLQAHYESSVKIGNPDATEGETHTSFSRGSPACTTVIGLVQMVDDYSSKSQFGLGRRSCQ